MRRSVDSLRVKALFVSITTLFLVLAASQLWQSIRFANLLVIADRLDRGVHPDISVVTEFEAQTHEIVDGRYCRSDIVMAGTSVALEYLDRQNVATGYDQWIAAASSARRYLEYALSCMPTNSNFWLRLAVVKAMIAEEPGETVRLLQQASRLAPADEISIVSRLAFWNKFGAYTLRMARPLVEEDVQLLLTRADPRSFVRIFKHTSANLKPFVIAAAQKLPEKRVYLLRAFGLNLGTL